MDDGGADGGAVAAIALIDVLDHLLAPLVLEVDVDVGRLAAVGGQEAGEQQVALHRVDRRHSQAVADHAVGRRAAPLAEDALGAGEGDDVVHGDEERCELFGFDERELHLQHRLHRQCQLFETCDRLLNPYRNSAKLEHRYQRYQVQSSLTLSGRL